MTTATIYRVTTTMGYQMGECGTNYRLDPWGDNTQWYEGYDDGGREYRLPEGYRVVTTALDDRIIVDQRGREADLCTGQNGPEILVADDASYRYIPLEAV